MTTTTDYKVGDPVEAEVFDGDWREGVVIGRKERANGQVFYRVSVRGRIGAPHLSAKRLRAVEAPCAHTRVVEDGGAHDPGYVYASCADCGAELAPRPR